MLESRGWNPPVVIAHRGSRELWPENTMLAFERASELGVGHLETDLRVSADDVVHCFHDSTLERVTHGVGNFSELTSKEVALLDAGYRHRGPDGFSFRGTGVKVPTLEELTVTFPGARVVVDLKDDAVVEPLARLVEKLGLFDRLVVGSFSDERLAAFREAVSREVPTSTGFKTSRRWFRASRRGRGVVGPESALQLPLQWRGLKVVDKKLVDAAHDAGLQVHVWTVNDENRMRDLLLLGVDGLITDRADLALRAIKPWASASPA